MSGGSNAGGAGAGGASGGSTGGADAATGGAAARRRRGRRGRQRWRHRRRGCGRHWPAAARPRRGAAGKPAVAIPGAAGAPPAAGGDGGQRAARRSTRAAAGEPAAAIPVEGTLLWTVAAARGDGRKRRSLHGTCTPSKAAGTNASGSGPHKVIVETNSDPGIKRGHHLPTHRPRGHREVPDLRLGRGCVLAERAVERDSDGRDRLPRILRRRGWDAEWQRQSHPWTDRSWPPWARR